MVEALSSLILGLRSSNIVSVERNVDWVKPDAVVVVVLYPRLQSWGKSGEFGGRRVWFSEVGNARDWQKTLETAMDNHLMGHKPRCPLGLTALWRPPPTILDGVLQPEESVLQ
jgi:hypothetical protein